MGVFVVDCTGQSQVLPERLSVKQTMFDETTALGLAMKRSHHWDTHEIARRRKLGDVCYIVMDQGECIHYSWMTKAVREISEIGYLAQLPPEHTWIYNCYTAPSHRGRSIYPRVLQEIVSDMCQAGSTVTWIDVDKRNSSSIRGLEKAGFHEVAVLEKSVFFSIFDGIKRRRIIDDNFLPHLKRISFEWL